MSTTTTNYGLVKPTLTETADINVINSNMDTLDTNLKAVSDRSNLAGVSTGIKKLVDTSRNTTTALANDPELSLALQANKFYAIEGLLIVHYAAAGTNGGFKCDLDVPGFADTVHDEIMMSQISSNLGNIFVASAGRDTGSSANAHSRTGASDPLGAESAVLINIRGKVQINSNGNLNVRWAQQVSQATPTILAAGSYLLATAF